MNKAQIQALIMMTGGFAMIAFAIAAATAAKMADPNAWLNEVLAIGHVGVFGAIGSVIVDDGLQSLKSARSGTNRLAIKKRRPSAKKVR